MELQRLCDANFDTLHNLATGDWQTVADELKAAGDNATGKVGGKIRGGSWEGFSGTIAGVKSERMEDQLDAAVTEAGAVKWLLWKGAQDLKAIQQKIKPLVDQVNANNPPLYFEDDYGTVEITPPDQKELISGSAEYYKRHKMIKLGMRLRGEIRALLKQATDRDVDIAKALLAATNLDDAPHDPNFNAEAGREGWPTYDPSVGRSKWYAKLIKTLFDDSGEYGGTPKEQSAAVGARAKSLAEGAGALCRMYEGMMVCVGAPSYMHQGGGVTYGDTFISPYASFDDLQSDNPPGTRHGLMDHEKYHRDQQWHKYGHEFGRMYLGSRVTGDDRPSGELGKETDSKGKPGPEINKYEWEAEHRGGDGHYPGGHDIPPYDD